MLGTNLKYLRKKNKLSQQELSDILDIPRTTLGDYEREKTEPNIAMLIKMSKQFEVKIDTLVTQDISHNDYEVMRNKDLRILAISVDADNDSHIELVDSKAEAGYLDSYHNPEYIKDLPKIALPNIPQGTYRAFEIQGDSMLPIESGSVIICAYVENIEDIKNDKTYIVISKREGMVYKRVKLDPDNSRLILLSDNNLYLPYKIDYTDIDEIWQYYANVSFSDDLKEGNLKVEAQLNDIHRKVTDLHQRLH